MALKYLYNQKTKKLHIEGYCRHVERGNGYIIFRSEDEALAYDGRAVGLCKDCQKKREQIEREAKK